MRVWGSLSKGQPRGEMRRGVPLKRRTLTSDLGPCLRTPGVLSGFPIKSFEPQPHSSFFRETIRVGP